MKTEIYHCDNCGNKIESKVYDFNYSELRRGARPNEFGTVPIFSAPIIVEQDIYAASNADETENTIPHWIEITQLSSKEIHTQICFYCYSNALKSALVTLAGIKEKSNEKFDKLARMIRQALPIKPESVVSVYVDRLSLSVIVITNDVRNATLDWVFDLKMKLLQSGYSHGLEINPVDFTKRKNLTKISE